MKLVCIYLSFCVIIGDGLLQVHTRLAGAILKKAINEAVREKEAYLAEAEKLLQKADAIDKSILRLQGLESRSTKLDLLLSERRVGRILEIDTPVLVEPVTKHELTEISTVYVLTWQMNENRAVLALPPGVVVALVSEVQARQIAHIMAQLDDFPLDASRLPIEEAASLADANSATLGIIFPNSVFQ